MQQILIIFSLRGRDCTHHHRLRVWVRHPTIIKCSKFVGNESQNVQMQQILTIFSLKKIENSYLFKSQINVICACRLKAIHMTLH